MRSFGTKDTTTTTTAQQQLSQPEFGKFFLGGGIREKKIVGPFEWKNVSSLTLRNRIEGSIHKARVLLL